jgi:predicted nucleotidyltransferase
MVMPEQIEQAVSILAETAHPRRIILFGSYARGEAGDDSDVDFLVIEEAVTDRLAEMARLRKALVPLRMPVDILVISADDFNKWSEAPSTTLYWAKRDGRVVYDAA